MRSNLVKWVKWIVLLLLSQRTKEIQIWLLRSRLRSKVRSKCRLIELRLVQLHRAKVGVHIWLHAELILLNVYRIHAGCRRERNNFGKWIGVKSSGLLAKLL